ncbi:MFS transporter [Derxia lacustris]|uniref:MFS transporter n=1 Tax=Derxia lacustris TaxID=764842 RepID=UPI001F319B3A|nr:MFS transporter [Derxia lacustris]
MTTGICAGAATGDRAPAWSGVLAMSLCAFALVASEFMPVSLLTPVAAALQVSEGLAGQGLAISGLCALLTSLFIASLAGPIDRKDLLLWLTGVMCLSGTVVALAQGYAMYLAGRALIGVVVGGFWSLSAATAMRLVPPAQLPQALAILNGGNALATVVAAPLGSYLGSVIGWRGAFFCLVPVTLATLVWQAISLPSMPATERAPAAGQVFGLLRQRRVRRGMAALGLFFMGQFMLFTYLRPYLERVTQVQGATLSLILLAIGLAGVVGTLLIGACLRRRFYGTLVAIPLLMAALAVALIAFGSSLWTVVTLLGLWGLVATAAPVGWWNWLARSLPHDAEAGGGLMVAVVQLAIGSGSTLGGLLFDAAGYRATFGSSAVLLLLAAGLAWWTARAD